MQCCHVSRKIWGQGIAMSLSVVHLMYRNFHTLPEKKLCIVSDGRPYSVEILATSDTNAQPVPR
jgi:hypothetical protein